MIVLLVGLLGHGKTLLMTIILYDYFQQKKQVYSNYNLSFGDKIKVNDLLNMSLNNCALGIDEAYTLLESRDSGQNPLNKLSSYFFFQSRKKRIDVYLTAQLGGTIDNRVRHLADYVILCERTDSGFYYSIFSKVDLIAEFEIKLKDAEEFFKMYDTEEIITPYQIDSQIEFKDVIEIFENSPTKKSFTTLMKKLYPQLGHDIVSSSYDFIKTDNIKYAKKILGIKVEL